jgi:hypothetical protein
MSSTSSSSDFESIFDAALSDYAKQTSIDLARHPFAQTLQNCPSADAIFDLLQDRAKQFQAYRDGNRKLIDFLKPVVQFFHAISGILGGAASLVGPANHLVTLDRMLTPPYPDATSTHKCDLRWCRCPPHSMYISYL